MRKRGDTVRLPLERGAKHQLVLLAEENAAAAIADHLRNEALDRQATAELNACFASTPCRVASRG